MMGFLGTVVYEGIEIVSSTAGTDYNTIDVSTAGSTPVFRSAR
jgi:hypothetical protein